MGALESSEEASFSHSVGQFSTEICELILFPEEYQVLGTGGQWNFLCLQNSTYLQNST